MALNAVAEGFGLNDHLPLPLTKNEKVESRRTTMGETWRDLLIGRVRSVAFGRPQGSVQSPRAIFPGAFNPLHAGHLRMAQIAAQRLGVPVELEISIENVDKPPLDYMEIGERAAEFTEKHLPFWFTRSPTFV